MTDQTPISRIRGRARMYAFSALGVGAAVTGGFALAAPTTASAAGTHLATHTSSSRGTRSTGTTTQPVRQAPSSTANSSSSNSASSNGPNTISSGSTGSGQVSGNTHSS